MFWLALGYPLLAHLSVLLADRRLQWLALVWLLGISLGAALIQRRTWAWTILIAAAVVLWCLVVSDLGLIALYVPSIVIPAALCLLFAGSLRNGQVPLITRIAQGMHDGPLPDDLVHYTRQVTVLWAAVSAGLCGSAVLFAWRASPELWSIITNLVHYLVLGAVFVLEYAWRRIRFRHHEHLGFVQFLRRLGRVRVR